MSPVIFNASNIGLVERLNPLTLLVPQDGIAHATPGQIVHAATMRARSAVSINKRIPGLDPLTHTLLAATWKPSATISLEDALPRLAQTHDLLASGTIQVHHSVAHYDFYAAPAPVLYYDAKGMQSFTQMTAVKRFAPSLLPLIPDAVLTDVDEPTTLLADVEHLAVAAVTLSNRTFFDQLSPNHQTTLRTILEARTLGNTMIGVSGTLDALEALAAIVGATQPHPDPAVLRREGWLNQPIAELSRYMQGRMLFSWMEIARLGLELIGDLYAPLSGRHSLYKDDGTIDTDTIMQDLNFRMIGGTKAARELAEICRNQGVPLGISVTKDGERYRLASSISPS